MPHAARALADQELMVEPGGGQALLAAVELAGGFEPAVAEMLAHHPEPGRVVFQINLGREMPELMRRDRVADMSLGALGDHHRQQVRCHMPAPAVGEQPG